MPIVDLPDGIISRLNILGLERLREFQFAVQIDGDLFGNQFVLGFESVIGLGDTIDVRKVQEGGHTGQHSFPRRRQNDAITLVRGMTLHKGLWAWFDQVRNWGIGRPDYRRTLSLFMLDQERLAGEPVNYEVRRWDVFGAWPSNWKGPTLSATSEGIAFESITIQHAGLSAPRDVFSGSTGTALGILQ